jgi:hypothetical protein
MTPEELEDIQKSYDESYNQEIFEYEKLKEFTLS